MKNYLLVYFFAIFTLLSCKNNKDEIVEMNLFLQENYEFNRKMLNQFKGDYYIRIQEQPESKIELLNELDTNYKELISSIDSAIFNQAVNIDKLILEYNSFLNEIEQVVNSNKEYLVTDLEPKITNKIKSKEFRLNTMKNKLAIAMVYAFEYASRPNYVSDGLYKIEVDSIISKTDNNGTKLTLTSKYGQTIKNNRYIIINKIESNGQEKKVDYKLKDNYSFTD